MIYAEIYDQAAHLQSAIADVFVVEDRTIPDTDPESVRFRGRLTEIPEKAYQLVSQRFREMGFTPVFRPDGDQEAIIAVHEVIQPRQSRVWINVLLFVLTVFSVLFTGMTSGLQDTAILASMSLTDWQARFWEEGLPFAGGLLAILLCHEFGHYFMARRHKVAASLPYFIPLPLLSPFGTMGAAILMKEPMRDRKVTFDIGVAGPLGGLIVAIPLLFVGLHLSQVEAIPAGATYLQEGNSLLYLLMKYLVFGRILPGGGYDVILHPLAWAAWVGLLVTFFNLFPAGQLDGGHVSYVLFGRRARYLSYAVVAVLALLGLLGLPEALGHPEWMLGTLLHRPDLNIGYVGWLLWAGLIFVFGLGHPPSLNELTRLDSKRRALAVFVLLLFVMLFMPVPLRQVGP